MTRVMETVVAGKAGTAGEDVMTLIPAPSGRVLLLNRFFSWPGEAQLLLDLLNRRPGLLQPAEDPWAYRLGRITASQMEGKDGASHLEILLERHPWLLEMNGARADLVFISKGCNQIDRLNVLSEAFSKIPVQERDPMLARDYAQVLSLIGSQVQGVDLVQFLACMTEGGEGSWGEKFIGIMRGLCTHENFMRSVPRCDRFRYCDGNHLAKRLHGFFREFNPPPGPWSLLLAFSHALLIARLAQSNYSNWDPLAEVSGFVRAMAGGGKTGSPELSSRMLAVCALEFGSMINIWRDPREIMEMITGKAAEVIASPRFDAGDIIEFITCIEMSFINSRSSWTYLNFSAFMESPERILRLLGAHPAGNTRKYRTAVNSMLSLLRGKALNQTMDAFGCGALADILERIADTGVGEVLADCLAGLCREGSRIADMGISSASLYGSILDALNKIPGKSLVPGGHIRGLLKLFLGMIRYTITRSVPGRFELCENASPLMVTNILKNVSDDEPKLASPANLKKYSKKIGGLIGFFKAASLPERVCAELFFEAARGWKETTGSTDTRASHYAARKIITALAGSAVLGEGMVKHYNLRPALLQSLADRDGKIHRGRAASAEPLFSHLEEINAEMVRREKFSRSHVAGFIGALLEANPEILDLPHWMVRRYCDLGMLLFTGPRDAIRDQMACMFILKLSEFIKKHSVLADPGHYPTLEKLVHFGIEYVKCSLHPDWFFYNFLEDCASANPSLFSDTDALENALLIAGKCIARGIAPLKDADRDREFYGLLDGYYSYRGGRFTELNSQTNRALLFSAMSTYEERLEYAYFMGKPVNIPRGNGWEMPGALLLVNGREIREISETVGDTAGLVNEVRAILLSLADNPSVMAGEAGLLSCLGRKERRFLVDKANFPNDDPAPVIERLWLRQARNYQPELARYFEKLLILKALKDNPGLRDVIRNGAANTAAAAIRDLLENTLLAALESSLHRTSVEYLTGMIEKETGLPLKNDAFRHMGLKEMSRTIRDEVRACTRLIDLHRVMPQFCSLAAGGSGPGRSLVPVGFSLNRKNEPLLLLDGVYKEYMRCYLRVEDEKGIKKIKQLKILPGAAFSLLGGRYESDIDLLNTDPEMEKLIYYDGEGLPACKYAMNLAEDEIRAIGRTVRVLTRRVLPLFSTLSTFGRAMLGRINRAMLSRWHTSQNPDELVLVPGKDQGLVLRYLPGLDCSSGINAQLAHPSSFFYRVVRGGKWIGYFLLLELRGVDGDRALLIDVINSGDHAAIDWAGVTERFTGYLAKAGRWGRVLLSTNSDIISNQDYIRDPVYARFRNHPRVPGDRYYLNPPDTSFHAPAFDYFDITGEG